MSLSLSPGMGSLADSTVLTGADGRAATTYEPLAPGTDTVEAVCGDSSASFSFEIAATPEPAGPDETFAYSHTEASLVLELLPLGDPGGLAPGAHVEMRLSARYETWDVHPDAVGNTRLENHTSAPAEGAAVTWWLESGDGHVSGHAAADAAGEATATLAMGHSDCLVRAEVSFAAANSASASFLFTAAPANYDDPAYYDPGYYEDPSTYTDPGYTDPGYTDPGYTDPGYTDPGYTDPGTTDPGYTDPGATSTYSHSETVLVLVNLAVSSPTPQVGESVTLSGEVRAEVWDVWTGPGAQRVYNYSQAAPGVLVELAEESGGGQLGAASATTDGSGWFSVSYAVGSDEAVSLSAAVAGSDPSGPGRASVQFWPQPADPGGPPPGTPSFLHHEGAWRLGGPQADGPTYGLAPGAGRILSGTLSYESWELWDDGQGGTETRHHAISPAPGEALEARLAYGDGQIGATSPGEGPVHFSTGPDGGFSLDFAMGTQASRVEILRHGEVLGHLDLVPPAAQPGPVWSWVRDESSLFVQLSAAAPGGDPGAVLDPGDLVEVRAEVLEASWEVWANEAGAVELRHHVVGPAVNVAVAFSKTEGPGDFAPDQLPAASTDLEGRTSALFVLGEAPARLRADATFLGLGSSAELIVSPDLWQLSSTEGSLELSLEAEGSPADTLAATVRYRSHQVWTRPATGESEVRHETLGPAAGAEILFSPGGDTAAAFATNSLLAGPDGTARTAYSSAGDGTIAVTARFAGLETHAEFAVPAGHGSVGGGGGDPGAGGDPGGFLPGEEPGAPGTPGTGSGTGGGGTPATPATPVPPLPQVVLKGRAHWTEGGGGGPGEDPVPINERIEGDESNIADYHNHLGSPWLISHGEEYEQVIVSLTAHLEKPVYGFGHEILAVQTRTVSGNVPEAQEELDEALAQGWRLVPSTEVEYVFDSRYYWWVELQGLIPGTDPSGEDFVVKGRPLPHLEIQLLRTIEGESSIAGLHDAAGSPPNPNVHLAPSSAEEGMEASFDSDAAWTEQDRIAEGHMGRAAPEMEAEANFTNGIVPSVFWSEYWLQAETALPQDAPDISRTFLLHVRKMNDEGETEQEAFGTVTFAVSEDQEISNAKPDVKGLEDFAAWIDARDDGTLRLRPPVVRGERNVVGLLPVELKVDYDRDGEDDILGDAGDNIPQDERFRFWINDDSDVGDDAEAMDTEESQEDGANDYIDGYRDLEDFTRLHIDLSSVQTMIEDGDMQVGLKMNGGGSIGVNYAADQDAGSEKFLFDQEEATNQRTIEYTGRRLLVDSSESWFPADISDRINSDGKLHLIFEGVTEGEGEIVLILKPTNGSTVEGPSVPIKLLPVARMYEHWTAGDYNASVGDRETVHATIAGIHAYPSKTTDSGAFEADGPEEDDVIVFVHGWRMTPWDRRSFGNTSFKRLWHSGFKGKFFNFSWPTGFTERRNLPGGPPEDLDNYPDSDEICYHVGEKSLKNFLDYLHSRYSGSVNLFAHSMGGIVSSNAFKSGGDVDTFAACQTAVVGHAYDPQFESRSHTWETPEVYADYPPTGAPFFETLAQKTYNFYNGDDDALDNWRHGQNLKPNESEGYSCHAYSAAHNDGNFLYGGDYPPLTFPSDTYEIYAHGAEGRSFALGTRELNGAKGNFDLQSFSDDSFNFGGAREDHSGQWNGTMMIRHEFWRILLLEAFGLDSSKSDQ